MAVVELDEPLVDEPLELELLELVEPELPDDGLPELLEPELVELPDEDDPESLELADVVLDSFAAALPESAEDEESDLSLLLTAVLAPARESVR